MKSFIKAVSVAVCVVGCRGSGAPADVATLEDTTGAPSQTASPSATPSTTQADVGLDQLGPCQDDRDCPPGNTFCDLGNDCQAPGVCTPRPRNCEELPKAGPAEMVCTCDGKTMSSCDAGWVSASIRSRGPCQPAPAQTVSRATCGKLGQCPKETPACVMGKGPERCTTRAEANTVAENLLKKKAELPGAYECTRPSDCGPGQSCCAGGALGLLVSSCQATLCDTANNASICETVADCAAFAKDVCRDEDCKKRVRCESVADHGVKPPVKQCRR